MSLWLSKHLVAAVDGFLSRGNTNLVAAVDAPQLLRALQTEWAGASAWHEGAAGLSAIVVRNLGEGTDWEERTRIWRDSMIDGALLVSVDKGSAAEVSRRFLCSGFSDISQARVGRRLVTCGRLVLVPR